MHAPVHAVHQHSASPITSKASELLTRAAIPDLVSLQNKPWSGPLSRELLVFNSFINGLSRTLRLLIEAICVQMLMSGEAKKHRDDFPDVACGT